MTWEEAANAKEELANEWAERLIAGATVVEGEYMKLLIAWLVAHSKGGYVTKELKTVGALADLRALLDKALKSGKFTVVGSDYLQSFEEMHRLNAVIQKDLNSIKLFYKDVHPIVSEFVYNFEQTLLQSGMNATVVFPIRQIFLNSIATGASIKNTETALRELVQGGGGGGGIIERYVGQATRDNLMQFDGVINGRIAKEYDLDALRYVGSLKPGVKGKRGGVTNASRPQCVRWVGKRILLLEDLQAEIDWAYKSGQGMKPGTTVDNFTINRGGYNCRHQAIPVRSEYQEL